MTVVADLSVNLTANTGRFSSGMKKAKEEAKSFGEVMEGLKHAVQGLAILEFGKEVFEIGHQMAEFVAHTIEGVEAVEKLGERIGATAEEIHGLHFAAKLAGASTEEMDTALQKMEEHLGKGSPETVKALASIGLRIEDLKKMGAAEAMGKIADGMKNLHTNAERAALAVELFGRGGAQMINLLRGGSEALEKAAGQSEKLRGSLSQLDSDNIKEATEAMKRMGEAAEGVNEKLAAKLAPAISAWAILKSGAFAEDNREFMGWHGALSSEELEKRHRTIEKLAGRASPEEEEARRKQERSNRAAEIGGDMAVIGLRSWLSAATSTFKEFMDRAAIDVAMNASQRQRAQIAMWHANAAVNEFSASAIANDLGLPQRKAAAEAIDLRTVARGSFVGDRIGQLGTQGTAADRTAKSLEALLDLAKGSGLKTELALGN